MIYYKRWVSQCQKKSEPGARQELERCRIGAWKVQGRSRAEARAGKEQVNGGQKKIYKYVNASYVYVQTTSKQR